MKVTVCIGSSCHLKGSRQIVEIFQKMISDKELEDQVELSGAFCMGNCVNGVNVKVDDVRYSVHPETAEDFFNEKVVSKLK